MPVYLQGSAWTKKSRLKSAKRKIRSVVRRRGSSVHKDALLIEAQALLREEKEAAVCRIVDKFLVVSSDLAPADRVLLELAKEALTPPWKKPAIVRIALFCLNMFAKWLIDRASNHFPVRATGYATYA